MTQICSVKKTAKKTKSNPEIRDKDFKRLGVRIKQLRIAKGYSSYEYFAYEHKLGRAQFGRYERGTEDIRYSTLLKIVKAFGMTLEEFFGEGF
jgi:transcriptional regulator with XRE-family HTH domain